ncbi:hypothetical protein P6144_13950 [Sphingomonas sp. HITSZ_GF]|uniref:hypothetical protein n=1 Tax=Sphingomonas sp. HITSZ_GF TaxID=3037247 RepID=UPI00240DE6B7|nr:hypothetical protein [Sphingomonas sp. HITSZ_GF]MDG2534761.1 hypothetical protein [Sphingomonas sp. HITSZ_GF]
MKAAYPLLLIVAAAPLAGCGAAQDPSHNEQQAAAAAQRAPDADKVMAERWAQMFANPKAVVAAANELGYKVEVTTNKGFDAKGGMTLPEKPKAVTVNAGFDAQGATADALDSITFSFDAQREGTPDRKDAEAYRFPSQLVRGFLGRFELGPGDTLNTAINQRKAVSVALPGANAEILTKPIAVGADNNDRPIIVTFTRTGASAPANQTQGK